MIFNGIEKEYLTVLRGRNRPAWAPIERELITVPGMSGAHLSHSKRQVRAITVPVFLMAENFSDLQKIKEDLAEWLIHDVAKELKFTDEPDRTYYAFVDGGLDLDEMVKWGEGVITFICPDPYKYGPEESKDVEDNDIIENKGTADADPIIELTTKKKSTFALISLGADEDSEYNLIGTPTEVDEEVVDQKTLVFDETGDTLDMWSIPNENSQGSFDHDLNGIFVDSYGTGDKWHGPSLEREITPMQDFEIEFLTSIRTEQDKMTFRTSLNFFDENMNELGLLRVWDKSNSRTAKIIEGRVGPYTGTNHENYPISSNNYMWKNQRVYNGIIRVRRIGNEYTFYAAHISQRGNHIETITKKFRDIDNDFMGRLKHIRLEASIYGSNPRPNELSITRVRVHEFHRITVDQTPNIVYPGDVITFDHKVDDILINGEPRNDLKNFGGSFFTLKKGLNNLIVTPPDSFDTKVTYRDKYL